MSTRGDVLPELHTLFERLRAALREQAIRHGFMEQQVSIRVRPMTPEQAIGNPDDTDYPIVKGRERILEAS